MTESVWLGSSLFQRDHGGPTLMPWREQPFPAHPEASVLGCWELAAPSDVCRARRQLRTALADGEPNGRAEEDALDRLLLVVEELASNGLRHGDQPVAIQVQTGAACWLVQVSDGAPDRLPQPAVDRDPALGGLGLHLVARLSDDYGWTVEADRKHVWACLPPPPVAASPTRPNSSAA